MAMLTFLLVKSTYGFKMLHTDKMPIESKEMSRVWLLALNQPRWAMCPSVPSSHASQALPAHTPEDEKEVQRKKEEKKRGQQRRKI